MSAKAFAVFLRRQFPLGSELVLEKMYNQDSTIESGTKGTINNIDDAGGIHVEWDNGQSSMVTVGVDDFYILV